jgi:hypothetical protein
MSLTSDYTRPDVTFTIEFMRVRESDNAHATLDRVANMTSDLEDAKVRAKVLFATLDLPQAPDAAENFVGAIATFIVEEVEVTRKIGHPDAR